MLPCTAAAVSVEGGGGRGSPPVDSTKDEGLLFSCLRTATGGGLCRRGATVCVVSLSPLRVGRSCLSFCVISWADAWRRNALNERHGLRVLLLGPLLFPTRGRASTAGTFRAHVLLCLCEAHAVFQRHWPKEGAGGCHRRRTMPSHNRVLARSARALDERRACVRTCACAPFSRCIETLSANERNEGKCARETRLRTRVFLVAFRTAVAAAAPLWGYSGGRGVVPLLAACCCFSYLLVALNAAAFI